MHRDPRLRLLRFLVLLSFCAATFFTSLVVLAGEIVVHTRMLPLKRPLRNAPVLLHPAYEGQVDLAERLRRPGAYRSYTDDLGEARFLGLPPGRYTVSFPHIPRHLLEPSENAWNPAPVKTLFDDEERLELYVLFEPGVTLGVAVETPGLAEDFVVHFRHRETGFERHAEIRPEVPRTSRLMSPGVWDVWVTSPPGRILTDVVRDSQPLPGHVATVELERPAPGRFIPPTWLTFSYEAPATIQGEVIVHGGTFEEVTIVADLVEGGDWHVAAEERGGSVLSPMTAKLTPEGNFHLDLPAGTWRLRPAGPRLVASEPAHHMVEVAARQLRRANFELEISEETRRDLRVVVTNSRGEELAGAVVHLVAAGALSPQGEPSQGEQEEKLIARGVTEPLGGAKLEAIPAGDYLLRAGHPDYMEAERQLYGFTPDDVSALTMELEDGAELYLRAVDLRGQPARDVVWTIEHLDPPLEIKLQDPIYLAAKTQRVAVTDHSGRVRVAGLYGGFYRLRAERPPRGRVAFPPEPHQLGALFHVGARLRGVRPIPLELYLSTGGSNEAWARQMPSASLGFELLCDDFEPLDRDVSVLVVDLDGPVDDMETVQKAAVYRREQTPLLGDGDSLLVGPLDQGVYRLAVRPAGFTRWTWAYQTHDGAESYPIQIDVDDEEPAAFIGKGTFLIECKPSIDLLPELLKGQMPDLRDVDITVHLLDQNGEDLGLAPVVECKHERAELRGLPEGRVKLDFELSHPHFLPQPDLAWQVDFDLQRGRYTVVTPQIERLGGAVLVGGLAGGGFLRVDSVGIEAFEVEVDGEEMTVPSLEPGAYAVTLCRDEGCREVLWRWEDVGVRAGETVRVVME